MDLFNGLDPNLVKWLIIPLLIFCARIMDVSLGTLRIIFISREDRTMAPILGFFEVLIWIIAIGQIMKHIESPFAYIGWASGFAVGNYVGLKIEQKLALGQMILRIIISPDSIELTYTLREMGYRVTVIEGEGMKGKVNILFSIVKKKEIPNVIRIVKQLNPDAFYTIENVQRVSDHYGSQSQSNNIIRRMFPLKKAK